MWWCLEAILQTMCDPLETELSTDGENTSPEKSVSPTGAADDAL